MILCAAWLDFLRCSERALIRSKWSRLNGIRGLNSGVRQVVTHEVLHGFEDAIDLRLECCFHCPMRLNICSSSQYIWSCGRIHDTVVGSFGQGEEDYV